MTYNYHVLSFVVISFVIYRTCFMYGFSIYSPEAAYNHARVSGFSQYQQELVN